jgi:hypothetical protein
MADEINGHQIDNSIPLSEVEQGQLIEESREIDAALRSYEEEKIWIETALVILGAELDPDEANALRKSRDQYNKAADQHTNANNDEERYRASMNLAGLTTAILESKHKLRTKAAEVEPGLTLVKHRAYIIEQIITLGLRGGLLLNERMKRSGY